MKVLWVDMPTIWVPKSCGFDFQSTKKYGQIKILLDENQSPFNIVRIRDIFRIHLQYSKPEDYIIPTGPSILNLILAIEWPHSVMRLLLYHAKSKRYVLKEITNV